MIAEKKDLPDECDIFKCARYVLSPTAESKHSSENIRVLAIAADNLPAPLLMNDPEVEAERIAIGLERAARRMRRNRPMPKNLAQHIVFAFSPGDFPGLSREQIARKALTIARESIKKVTRRRRMAIYAVHGDRDHIHVHCIVCTVDLEVGLIFNPHQDYRLWELEMERQELRCNLTRVKQRKAVAIRDRDPSRRIRRAAADGVDLQTMKKSLKAPWNTRVQNTIDRVLKCALHMGQFLLALEKEGVTSFPRVQAGRCVGIAFRYDGNTKTGSKLGSDYSFKGLIARGVSYDVERDREVIEIFCAKSAALRAGAEVAVATQAIQPEPSSAPESVVSSVPAPAEIHVVEQDIATSVVPQLSPVIPKQVRSDEGQGITSPLHQRTGARIMSDSANTLLPASDRPGACAPSLAGPVLPLVSGKPAARSAQPISPAVQQAVSLGRKPRAHHSLVVAEYQKRVRNMPAFLKKSGIERRFAVHATLALQASGGVLGKVDWQQVENATLREAILAGVLHKTAVYAIAELSPRLADPARRMAFLRKFAPADKSVELGDKTECLVSLRRG